MRVGDLALLRAVPASQGCVVDYHLGQMYTRNVCCEHLPAVGMLACSDFGWKKEHRGETGS